MQRCKVVMGDKVFDCVRVPSAEGSDKSAEEGTAGRKSRIAEGTDVAQLFHSDARRGE